MPPAPKAPSALDRAILPVGRSGWAIAAGYMALFGLLVLPAPAALLLGIVAAIDLVRHPEKHGWGRTGFALVVGVIGSVVLVLAWLN
jgi:hypothetical protein